MVKHLALLITAGALLSGCVSTVSNIPNPTATEQLLPAHASERAAAALNLKLPIGAKVFLDVDAIGAAPADKYLVAAVRAHMLGRGLALVDRSTADIVVELRLAADGLDDVDRLLGVPGTVVPSIRPGVPAISTPEISLFSRHERSGIVEISAVAIDAHSGRLVAAVGPIFAVAKIVNQHVLGGLVFGDELERPGIRAGVK